ncbi:dienelactone hydrolase family protein [Chryseolinea sp. H1M3-3]|uniref:alpha/beta hydrolase n=1 Tax=Chryseolinea sp. H1M3-3 TaxID=3034144 RepID=UPI0023EBBE6F|nr:dienelactone hydrolase family protein [Chryseolinea sp. H1M3-3]
MHQKEIVFTGKKLDDAKKALIMLHGRGASAEDILRLKPHLRLDEFAVLAPQATNHTWYPYSFLVPRKQNEPWLSSAIDLITELVHDINNAGIIKENIYFLGFSQGACLALEYIARHATKWGGAVAFTGGLIGDKVFTDTYTGDFQGTPIFIGTSNPDPHVPVERVNETTLLLKKMNASVTEKVYQNMGHTINEDEIELANKLVFSGKDI